MTKINYVVIATAIFSVFTANAGVVTGTNIIDGTGGDIIITDNTGSAIAVGGGFVSLGYFSIHHIQIILKGVSSKRIC